MGIWLFCAHVLKGLSYRLLLVGAGTPELGRSDPCILC